MLRRKYCAVVIMSTETEVDIKAYIKNMETNNSPLQSSIAKPISFPSEIWLVLQQIGERIEEQYQKLKALQDRWRPDVVLPQTAEITGSPSSCNKLASCDINTQPQVNSASLGVNENERPQNNFDIRQKSKDIHVHQRLRARRAIGTIGSGLRTIKNSSAKVKKRGHFFLLFALAMITLPPGTEGYDEHVLTRRIHKSVMISSDAKQADVVTWLLNPASDPDAYITIYRSALEGDTKKGCGGYQFQKDHTILITSVQPCHAGVYTAEYADRDPLRIVLIVNVNDTDEFTVPMETTNAFDIMGNSSSTSSSSGYEEPQDIDNTLTIISAVCVTITLTITSLVVIIILCVKGKCRNILSNVAFGGIKTKEVNYAGVSCNEV